MGGSKKRDEGNSRKTNGLNEKVGGVREVQVESERMHDTIKWGRKGVKTGRGIEGEGNTWQPVTMQIHFKALLREVGSKV